MRALDAAGQAPARAITSSAGNVDAALARQRTPSARRYAYHYQGHMPIGPSCAVADVTADGALVLANTQDAYRLRTKARRRCSACRSRPDPRAVLGGRGVVRQRRRRGSTTGGRRRCMSQLAGAPVRLQFMRWDEHGWDNYGPAVLADVRGGGRRERARSSRSTTRRSGSPRCRCGRRRRASTSACRSLPPGLGSASTRTRGTQYEIPNRRVTASRCRFERTSSRRRRCARRAPADDLRLGAAGRRARARGRHRPVSSSGCRT